MKNSTRGASRRNRRASARALRTYHNQLLQALRRAGDRAVELGVPIEQASPAEPVLMKASCSDVYRAALAELRSLRSRRQGALSGKYSARRAAQL